MFVLDLVILAVVGILVLTFVIGMPIGIGMFISGVLYLFLNESNMSISAHQMLSGLNNSYVLIAVPLFIFSANIMNSGKLSEKLLNFSLAIVGRIKGGLAHMNVLVSLIFSGMSGSAIADAAGVGKMMIDMMTEKNRYPRAYACAVTAASAVIGPVIPPSIPMVLYSLVSGASVGFLFLGGIIPGLMIAGIMMIIIYIQADIRDFPTEEPVPLKKLPMITFRSIPVLVLPVILLGGIYGGITTPTEAASIAAAYALLVCLLFYRNISWKELESVLFSSAKTTASIGLMVGGTYVLNYIVTNEGVPQMIAQFLANLSVGKYLFLFIVNIVILLLGCFLDANTVMLIFIPLLLPACRMLGVDLVHFGVVVSINTMIGLITPPYGILIFVINNITNEKIGEIVKELIPFLIMHISLLMVLTFIPDIVLFLPRVFGYTG